MCRTHIHNQPLVRRIQHTQAAPDGIAGGQSTEAGRRRGHATTRSNDHRQCSFFPFARPPFLPIDPSIIVCPTGAPRCYAAAAASPSIHRLNVLGRHCSSTNTPNALAHQTLTGSIGLAWCVACSFDLPQDRQSSMATDQD